MPKQSRTREANRAEARIRADSASAYVDVAELVIEDDGAAMPGVAAGLAVLAGIAASDAICACHLGRIHRGDDHRSAAALLITATPDGAKLAASFRRLIDIKDEAHYGLSVVPERKARDAVKRARSLVDRAIDELQR